MNHLTQMTDEELLRARSEAQIALVLARNDPDELLQLVTAVEQTLATQRDGERAAEEWLRKMDNPGGEKV